MNIRIIPLLLLPTVCTPADATEGSVPIDMSVTLGESVGGRQTLKLSLENTGSEPVKVESTELPWGNRYSIDLAAVQDVGSRKQLQLVFPIDDPVNETIEIGLRHRLGGQIFLVSFFPANEINTPTTAIIVIWTYQLHLADGRRSARKSGAVLLDQVKKR